MDWRSAQTDTPVVLILCLALMRDGSRRFQELYVKRDMQKIRDRCDVVQRKIIWGTGGLICANRISAKMYE